MVPVRPRHFVCPKKKKKKLFSVNKNGKRKVSYVSVPESLLLFSF